MDGPKYAKSDFCMSDIWFLHLFDIFLKPKFKKVDPYVFKISIKYILKE